MNKCVYTIRFGGYDASHEPPKSDGWDYIVFSDREIESDVWETRIVRTPLGKEYNFMNARYVYINSHRFVPEYDFSLMVGGQIHINGDLNEKATAASASDNPFSAQARSSLRAASKTSSLAGR